MLIEISEDIIHEVEQVYYQVNNLDLATTIEDKRLVLLRTEMMQKSISEKVLWIIKNASNERRKTL